MPRQTLRDYQERGIAQILAAYRAGARSVLAVAPTGSGKTTVFSHILAELDARGQRGVILVHRRELAIQACTRLREFGVRYGLILAGERADPTAHVQVASVQTLVRRRAPQAQLVVPDEAHLSTAATWRGILEQYPDARILGVTATPWRLAGKPLADAYDDLVVIATPRELREQGHLCDYAGFSYLTPDLSGVATVAGDYNERDSAAAMSSGAIVANVVEEWLAHASALSTVVFAVTVEHSRQLTAQFKAAGVRAEHLDGATGLQERGAILGRVASGATRVLCNVGVAVEGLDIPRLKCCVLARPTRSLARAIQMMGRVRRPWEGVTARIHDHAFVIRQHGLPDADRDYTLNAKLGPPPSLTTCTVCMAMYSGTRCPSCEHEPAPRTERILQTMSADGLVRQEFDSGSVGVIAAAPARNPAPVKLDWATTKIGRMIDGVFLGTSEEETSFNGHHGKRKRHLLRGEERDYSLPGTADLDKRMAKVAVGGKVQVTYEGRENFERAPHKFKVAADDGVVVPEENSNVSRYLAGESFASIARDLKVNPSTVRREVLAHGVEPRSMSDAITGARGHDLSKRDESARLRATGMKLKDISDTLEVGVSTIHQWLKGRTRG